MGVSGPHLLRETLQQRRCPARRILFLNLVEKREVDGIDEGNLMAPFSALVGDEATALEIPCRVERTES